MKIIYFPTSPPTYDEGDDADVEGESPSHLEQEQTLCPSKTIEKKKLSKRTKKNESLLDSFLVEEEEEELTSGRRLRKRKNTKKIVDEDPLELSAPSSPEASWQKKKKKKAPVSHDHDDNSDPDFELPLESDHEEDLTCKICKKRFSKAFNLRAHSLTAHLKTPQEQQEHPCPICGKPFPLPSLNKKHQWTHFNAEEKEEAISRGDQPVPARYQSRFQCELCPKRFKTPGDLKRHQETVHVPIEERKELCPFCGDSFASLQRHIARVHETTEEDKKHACFVCGKRFATQQEFHNHRLVHDGKREWKCDQCPREFNLEKQLKKHKNSHLNIRRFQCQHCESAFTSKSNLTRHTRIYHGEGGSKARRPRYIRGPAKTKFRKGGSESKVQTEVHLETDDLPKL
ncbi:unnamed protein product [Orchesella dallaii]|uniref:Zinc finger protein n=1 Tax=Orchesella dallaii TaxID=48710 RepID=A0ABP1Q009_9HEXA